MKSAILFSLTMLASLTYGAQALNAINGALLKRSHVEADDSCVDDEAGIAAKNLRWVAAKLVKSYDILSCADLAGFTRNSRNLCSSPQYREDAARYCCSTCKSAPIRIIFGGEEHGANTWGALERPEGSRSEHCTSAECFECSNDADCWHGVAQSEAGSPGNMGIDVQPNSGFTSFAYSVYATCVTGESTWSFRLNQLINAHLNVYVNGVLKLTMGTSDVGKNGEKIITIAETKARIRVVLIQDDVGLVSHAKLKLMAKDVAMSTDDCLSLKDCLSILGDGSAASFSLRNVNELQLHCLQYSNDNTMASTMSLAVLHKCDEWLACLDPAKVQALEVLLLAAGVGSSNPALAANVRANESTEKAVGVAQDPNSCYDPAIQDPESWDCECMEAMIASCGGADEACIRDLICQNDQVCQEWKTTHCSDEALEVRADGILMENRQSAKRVAAKQSAEAWSKSIASHSRSDTSMDSTLSAKCID